MGSAKIEYRDLSPEDFPYLRAIIGEAWGLNDYTREKKLRDLILQHYLYYYLKNQNFVRIATADGIPVGLLFGRSENQPRKHTVEYCFYAQLIALVLVFLPVGRRYLRNARTIGRADRMLLKRSNFGGELVLFAVDARFREHGIGKHLLDAFKKFLEDDHVSDFYLFTDDYSDVDYYRMRGYRQLAQLDVTLEPDDGSDADDRGKFYIFEYVLHEKPARSVAGSQPIKG
jgi:ribosomal protein S18 acetylase RimI-like enzyme